MSKDIIILGMHRSGTSLTSSICQDLGVNIGKNLIGALPSNPAGHFENIEFVEFHDKLLAYCNSSWMFVPDIDSLSRIFNDNIEEAKYLINRNKSELWGWKDPRNSLFFTKYIQLLENPMLIICYRNPYSVANSLYKRDNIKIADGLRLTNVYNKYIINGIADINIPILCVPFENYFIHDMKYRQIDSIVSFIGSKSIPNYNIVVDKYADL